MNKDKFNDLILALNVNNDKWTNFVKLRHYFRTIVLK